MITCKECGRDFHSLGFARHRTAHYERRKSLYGKKPDTPMPKPRIKKYKKP